MKKSQYKIALDKLSSFIQKLRELNREGMLSNVLILRAAEDFSIIAEQALKLIHDDDLMRVQFDGLGHFAEFEQKKEFKFWYTIENEFYSTLLRIADLITNKDKHLAASIRDITRKYQNYEDKTLVELHTLLDTYREQLKEIKIDSANFKKDIREQTTKAYLERTEEYQKLANEILESITATKENADKLYTDAKNVLDIIQEKSQTTAFRAYADQEQKTANRTRRYALGFMALAITILVIPPLFEFSDLFGSFYERLPISILFLTPAFYLARESSQHRTNENYSRRTELKLASIDAYLDRLENTQSKESIKEKMAERIFLSDESITVSKEQQTLAKELTELLKAIKDINK